ncbi:MAG: cupredoxin domain-containing protein [Betaproteobacteria bacterium]|nr:cupredoxin domain-containing protein [Betaproteobacteria bacterium]
MLARVAEHPGVPREVSGLPSWFTGAPAVPGEAAAAHGHEAGAAIASIGPGAPAAQSPEKTAAAEGDYAQFANGKVEIALTEYEMKPRKLRTRPGTVTFVLRNDGRFAHNFHVEGPGIDTTADKFSPGRTVRLELALQEGEYKISCPLSNHDQRGMHGTLVVTAKLAGK